MKHIKTFENSKSDIEYNISDLMLAAKENDLNKVKKIINSGFNINTKVSNVYKNKNIVNWLCIENSKNYDIIDYLIKSGADVNCVDQHGDTPLTFVAYKPTDMKLLKLLIDADADWNHIDGDGYDFLEYLTDYDKRDIIEKYPEKYQEYLIKKDANKYNL